MLDSKLILVEGIPGSGKSTTAQWIALELQKRQIPVDWFMDEHRGNPITIWDGSSLDGFITKTLENWKGLAQSMQSSDQIIVLEGCLFQHFLQRLLAEDMERAGIISYVETVYEHIRPLNPILIYFYQSDLALSLKTIHAERGQEWSDYMIKSVEESPFAKARGFRGFDALIQYYQEAVALTHQLLNDGTFRTLIIENSEREWRIYRDQIRQFLSLSPMSDQPIRFDDLRKFEGRYRDLSGTHPHNPECTIRLLENGLVIYDFRYPKSNLIPKTPNEFTVETLGYELIFETNSFGQVEKMKVGGKEPGVGIGPVTLLGRTFHRISEQ